MTPRERLLTVLLGALPDRVPFAPNIWQWFEYHKLHNQLPNELRQCDSHLDALRILGVDIFSRNLITDIRSNWYGGHAHKVFKRVEVKEQIEGDRRVLSYHTPEGILTEALQFNREGCTLVQLEYLFKSFEDEYPAWYSLFDDFEFSFDWASYDNLSRAVGKDGVVMVGETTSPLKQLHMCARADQTTFLLADHEREMVALMDLYAMKALGLIKQLAEGGIPVIISMDNLDSTFYPPPYFERYCESFFRQASEICHRHGAFFFSHACGQQRRILPQVVRCGIDGLEGIAFPPLGDVDLWEAREVGEAFVVMGGLSAAELEGPVTREDAEKYVERLFSRLRPFHRFIFSMSCNTSIRARWDTLLYFRDAWCKFGWSGGA